MKAGRDCFGNFGNRRSTSNVNYWHCLPANRKSRFRGRTVDNAAEQGEERRTVLEPRSQ